MHHQWRHSRCWRRTRPLLVVRSGMWSAQRLWKQRPAMSSRRRCGLRGMTSREPTATTNLDQTSETEPLPWKRAHDLLDAGALAEAASFLGTVRPDGRPHSARVGAAWYDG